MILDITHSKILIVDDIKANIKLLQKTLGDGFVFDYALDGEGALTKVGAFAPDIILLDVMMPGINGYEVCRRLKAEGGQEDIPIIFITSKDDEEFESRGFEVGAVDYITKPFKKSIVQARVRSHLTLKKQREMLENLSNIDGLTGIPNRRAFDAIMEREWRRAKRKGGELSLIMSDIDYFKKFNDALGHLAGDDCLRQVAKALLHSVHRPYDFVGRYGGEEFVTLLPNTDEQGVCEIAEIMRRNIAELIIEHPDSNVAAYVSISLGTATILPSSTEDSTLLVRTADNALYQSKKEGRNKIVSGGVVNMSGAK